MQILSLKRAGGFGRQPTFRKLNDIILRGEGEDVLHRISGHHGTGFTPFSFAILYGWMAFGLLSIIMFWVKLHDQLPASIFQPPVFELISGLMIMVGSGLMLAGSNDWEDVRTGWMLDNIGMIFATGSWVLYSIAIFPPSLHSIGEFAICVLFIAALVTRFLFTRTYERFVKSRVFRLWKTGSIQQL